MDDQQTLEGVVSTGLSRRRFFGLAGALAGAGLLAGAAGCKKDDDGSGINLGSGDTGVLNYAYALEQLEAAFYIQVVQSLYSSATAMEQAYFTDIRDHEIAHREFFKAALGSSAIQGLTPNFSSVNFSDRSSVLATAKAFEDLGVSAYNGAGKLLTSADNLTIAGKIVSVEARHAAEIRDLISNGSFADSTAVDGMGLDLVRTPAQVLAIAGAYISESLNASNLPTS
jgi:rubrerythrin